MSSFAVNASLIALLALIAFMALRLHRLFAVVMLSGAFSLTAAAQFVVLDAVDVAFTEAAVGAGISTVLALATLSLVPAEEKYHSFAFLPAFLAIATGFLLIAAVSDLPPFGDPLAPIHMHVAPDYIAGSAIDIDVPNVVTSVLASYRGFDTLGETVVVFTAAVAVLLIIGGHTRTKRRSKTKEAEMQDDVVMRVVAKVMIPAVMLFALYVQFHGDFGPGGGFQAGVIFAAAFVLHAMIFGLNRARHVWPPHYNVLGFCAGVLLYGGTGVASMLLGDNFLAYNVLGATPSKGQHLGILLVEFGVGLTVASVMVSLFLTFAGRVTHLRFLAKSEAHERYLAEQADEK